jgi:hypothetical protein
MGTFDEKIAEIRKEIKADRGVYEDHKFHTLQADRYFRLADALDEKAESLIEKPPEPEAQDTF